MNPIFHTFIALMPAVTLAAGAVSDRRAVVERHNICFTELNPAEVPQVGNGEIAFGIDVTGLQSFYGNNLVHIDVIGTGAFLPGEGVDLQTLGRTVDKAFAQWDMASNWGWDFPWLAMAAARAGKPQRAVDALFLEASYKNDYSRCGINRGGPAHAYLPGNGGLLYAVAMMAAGWDGGPDKQAPGFPGDGTWVVKHEGLRKAQ